MSKDTREIMRDIISSVKKDLASAFENALVHGELSELETKIADFGITFLAIIDISGQPLVMKSYAESSESMGDDSLFAGFISALSNFAKEEFHGKIQDISINNQRMFFRFEGSVIFIITIMEKNIFHLEVKNFNHLSEQLFQHCTREFRDNYEEKRLNHLKLHNWLDDFENYLDEFLFESIQNIKIKL